MPSLGNYNIYNTIMDDKLNQQAEFPQSQEGDPVNINADENMTGNSGIQEELAEQDRLEKLEAELQEQKDKYLRLYAEFDNFKRRTAKERIELIQTAGKDVIVSLLDVLDDCDRAEKQLQSIGQDDPIRSGVMLVFNKLRQAMQAKGLKPMESTGADFDPDKHEAITQIPAPSPDMQGKIIDTVTNGYYLNDKIIRFAKVVVAN